MVVREGDPQPSLHNRTVALARLRCELMVNECRAIPVGLYIYRHRLCETRTKQSIRGSHLPLGSIQGMSPYRKKTYKNYIFGVFWASRLISMNKKRSLVASNYNSPTKTDLEF